MPRRHVALFLFLHANKEQKRQADREEHGDHFEGVHVGEVVTLADDDAFERGHSSLPGFDWRTHVLAERLLDALQALDGGGVVGREVFEQIDAVDGDALGDVGVGDS